MGITMDAFSQWLPPFAITPLISSDEAAQVIQLAENSQSFKPLRILDLEGRLETKESLPNARHAYYSPGAAIYDLIAARLQAARGELNQRYDFHLFPAQKHCIPYVYVMRYRADADRSAVHSHIDLSGHGTIDKRKLTVIIPLNAATEFTGGHLHVDVGAQYDVQDRGAVGDAIVFPSFTMHNVTTLESGVRYSAVAWLHGPRFR